MKVLIAGTGMFFYAFAIARAVRVPLTFDEAAAFLRYIDTGYSSVFHTDLFSIFDFEVATNHFLNTLLTKLAYLAAGSSELTLRAPNLAGYAMYMAFALLLLRRYTTPLIVLGGLLLLNLNPYVLDFFALSRGYGLSLGFLMAALFFFFRFADALRTREAPRGDVARALGMACGAVMANFALLNVYLAIFSLATVMLVVFRAPEPFVQEAAERGAGPVRNDRYSPRASRRIMPWLPIIAIAFTGLVLSQDLALSDAMYESVSVRLAGLKANELEQVTVSKVDIRGRDARLVRDAGTPVWRVNGRSHIQTLRIELPVQGAKQLTLIETVVGHHSVLYDDRHPAAWITRPVGNTRVFESDSSLSLRRSRIPAFRPIMNWAGDATYAASLARKTALVLLVLAACGVLLRAMEWLVVRTHLLPRAQWRVLAAAALWLAVLAGTPLYLLQRDAQLYFGGTHGLVADTFHSIIENSFYGRRYHPAQTQIAFAGVLATVAIFAVVVVLHGRRKTVTTALPGMYIAGLFALTAMSLVAQRVLFQTVYLAGRTALFYIPLYVLFFIFVCDALARLGRSANRLALVMLALAVAASASHFMTTANVRFAWDWQDDASSKMMIDDVLEVITAERPPRSRATVGVSWIYAPVSVYYAHRKSNAIDVVVRSTPAGTDFFYGAERSGGAGVAVIRRYPFTHTALFAPGITP